MTDPNFLLALFLLVCSGIGTAATLVWKMTRVEQALREAIARSRDEIEANQAAEARLGQETLLALRQKINDVELHAANTYIRREGFYAVQDRFIGDMVSLREAIDARFVRLEEKIDKLPRQ